MPITMAKSGDSVEIKRITGKDDTRRFLASLGFIEGEQVTVVSEMAGNVIINVKDTRVAVDKTMARRIMI